MSSSAVRHHVLTPPVITDRLSIPQYTRPAVVAVWAAAALPMAALAWLAVPRLAGSLTGPAPLGQALLICLTAGLVWQFVLVLGLVAVEQRSLRWAVLRQALWLQAPRSPRTGRAGGRTWLVLLPLLAAFVAVHAVRLLPWLPYPADRDLGSALGSEASRELLHGHWGWFALAVTMFLFNTVLGEELLFRGFLLPRMRGAFGNRDWLANGILFALYHLHEWWVIPTTLLDSFILAYPSKRFRSAWIGIAVHSAQSVFFTVLLLGLVL
jgi:CAAX protease family protein